MFRRGLRQSSIRVLRPGNVYRIARDRHASSSKTKSDPSRPSLNTRLQTLLTWPFTITASILDTHIPRWRRVSRNAVGVFLFWHIFTSYFFSINACDGISMLPTINSYGDWIIISKYYRRGRGIEIGDLVSYHHPVEEEVQGVKRVIGLEGDFVLRDTPGTTGKMIQIPQGHCWIVGDNLKWSRDSRLFGPIPLALIRGKVVLRYTPWTSFKFMKDGLQDSTNDEQDVD